MCCQEFLRSVPGSLLCCELHEEWVDVLEEEEEEGEQVQEIKRCAHIMKNKVRSSIIDPASLPAE